MKNTYLKMMALVFCFLLPFFLTAQNSIQGKVKNWTHGESIIAYFGMFNGEMTQLGSIKAGGDFQIPLDPDYLNTFRKIAEKEAAEAPPGWTMSYKTMSTTFFCNYDESITTQNGDAIITGLPELILTDKTGQAEQAILYAVNSPEVAVWLRSYGDESISPGYYLSWIFSEGPALASGECKVPFYTGNDDEMNHDTTILEVKLEKGWNILKYDIVEIFTSKTGKTYPSKTLVSRLEALPDDVQWVAIDY